jgi:hypothetical protein
MCTVPQLIGLQSNQVKSAWTGAGFTGTVTFTPDWPPRYTITSQSLAAGASEPCTSSIAVSGTP